MPWWGWLLVGLLSLALLGVIGFLAWFLYQFSKSFG